MGELYLLCLPKTATCGDGDSELYTKRQTAASLTVFSNLDTLPGEIAPGQTCPSQQNTKKL